MLCVVVTGGVGLFSRLKICRVVSGGPGDDEREAVDEVAGRFGGAGEEQE